MLIGTLGVVVVLFIGWFYRHQVLLRDRAHLMREAIRNQEFTFRLPVKGLFFGERALQEALNETGRDIGRLLARNEVESWQRLTRVLTHEIMNATTPIASISQAYLEHPAIAGTVYEEGIRALYPDLEWHLSIPLSAMMRTDQNMLRQVLINLIRNACEAGATTVDVRWKKGLWVSNNGAPIPVAIEREIFIPFFTTKSTGSGIGLSLSRQMMVRQGGDLCLAQRSVPGYQVTFIISCVG